MKPIFLITLSLLFFLACKEEETLQESPSLITELKIEIDSLRKELVLKTEAENYWFNNDHEGLKFIESGIKNPKEEIESCLRGKPELIPLSAILGGTMDFGKIEILSDKWILADYNDGHIEGKSIFEYTLEENGTFSFKLLDSTQAY